MNVICVVKLLKVLYCISEFYFISNCGLIYYQKMQMILDSQVDLEILIPGVVVKHVDD